MPRPTKPPKAKLKYTDAKFIARLLESQLRDTGNSVRIGNVYLKIVSDGSTQISSQNEKRLTLYAALRFLDSAAGRKLLKGRAK